MGLFRPSEYPIGKCSHTVGTLHDLSNLKAFLLKLIVGGTIPT
jgi:hypothetical protein